MTRSKNKTILLIEDNPDLRSATRDLLEALGCDVLVARDLEQALDAARKESPDLVLVNAYPGDGSGLATVDALRAAVPSLPALLVSGFGDDGELRRRVLSGNVSFLTIPFSQQALDEQIAETLKQRPERPSGAPANRQEVAHLQSSPGKLHRPRIFLVAATAILVAGLAFQLANREPRMPERGPGETRRGHTIELLEPIGALASPPKRLTWRQAPNTDRYRVVLSTVDDTPIWQSETRETSIDLPEEVLTQLHSAVSYFWQVEGLGENLSHTGQSILVAFRFGPSEPA